MEGGLYIFIGWASRHIPARKEIVTEHYTIIITTAMTFRNQSTEVLKAGLF